MSYLDGLDSERRQRLLQLAASRPQPAAAPPPPHGHVSAADAARLRVRAHTLAEENASLRRNLQAMVAQAKRSESELQVGHFCCAFRCSAVLCPATPARRHNCRRHTTSSFPQALRRTATAKQQRTEQQHATTAAVLEEQAARQQRALLDLARTAQSLAPENAQLHGRLAALQVGAAQYSPAVGDTSTHLRVACLEPRAVLDRSPLLTLNSTAFAPHQDENQDAERAQQALQERLAQLQHLCLELDRQPPAGGGGGCSSGGSGSVPPGSLSAGAAGDRAAAGSGRQAELLERLSCTLRALGPANGSPLGPQPAAVLPPATAPGKVRGEAGVPLGLQCLRLEIILRCDRVMHAHARVGTPIPAAPGPCLQVQAAAKGLPIDLRLALRELEGLRKERDGLASKLKAAEAQVGADVSTERFAWVAPAQYKGCDGHAMICLLPSIHACCHGSSTHLLTTHLPPPAAQAAKLRAEQEQARQSLVRERHATAAATAELQRQLKTARERAEGLVGASDHTC